MGLAAQEYRPSSKATGVPIDARPDVKEIARQRLELVKQNFLERTQQLKASRPQWTGDEGASDYGGGGMANESTIVIHQES